LEFKEINDGNNGLKYHHLNDSVHSNVNTDKIDYELFEANL